MTRRCGLGFCILFLATTAQAQLFVDGFESGNLGEWVVFTLVPTDTIAARASSAQRGSFGLLSLDVTGGAGSEGNNLVLHDFTRTLVRR